MSDKFSWIVVGNVTIFPHFREVLKKSVYYMTYNPDTMELMLSDNYGGGGQDILAIRNVPYESAVKLAETLGLKPGSKRPSRPTYWSKWVPIHTLYHDGSSDAERLRMRMLDLGLPFRLINREHHTDSGGRKYWAWTSGNGSGLHTHPSFSTEDVLQMIEADAERYKDQLATF